MNLEDLFSPLYASEVGVGTVVIRLLVAAALGAALGIDREILSRPAGMRTHILVSLAAATFTVVTFELMERAKLEGTTSLDPIRVIEAVTAGVAFLAAGAIIQARGKVHGVTTGAGLWLAGAIGTAAGIGAYLEAVLATIIGVIVLTLLRPVEESLPKAPPPKESGTKGKDS
jgi:putative Mg2+ transporter-C (MgtC) family protein